MEFHCGKSAVSRSYNFACHFREIANSQVKFVVEDVQLSSHAYIVVIFDIVQLSLTLD